MLELVAVGAHYDPVELLRPGWPLHRELDQLAARAPLAAQGPAGSSRSARTTGDCRARWRRRRISPAARCACCRSCLTGDAAVIARVGDAFERDLLERGMAGADTALAAQEAFGLHGRTRALPHRARPGRDDRDAVRTRRPGAAVAADRNRAAGAGRRRNGWTRRRSRCCITAEREVRIALLSPPAWRARYAAGHATSTMRGWNAASSSSRRASASSRRCWARTAMPVTFVHCERRRCRATCRSGVESRLRSSATTGRRTSLRRVRPTELCSKSRSRHPMPSAA